MGWTPRMVTEMNLRIDLQSARTEKNYNPLDDLARIIREELGEETKYLKEKL